MFKTVMCFFIALTVCKVEAAIQNNIELLDYNSIGSEVEDSVMGVSCWGYEKDGVEYAIIGKGLYYDFDDQDNYVQYCSLLVYSIDEHGDLEFEKGYPGVVYPEEIVVYESNDSVYAYLCGHCNEDSVYVYNLSNTSLTKHVSSIFTYSGVHGMHVDDASGVLFMGKTCGFELRMYNIGTNPKNPHLLGNWAVPFNTTYDIYDEFDTENRLQPGQDTAYFPGISDIYVTGSPYDNTFRVFIAAVRSGLFIADITAVTLNDAIVSLSISSSNVRQIKYRACRDTAAVDSDYALCHSVWLDDNEEYIFVGTEINHHLAGNHLGALSIFELDSDDIDNLVDIDHANSPNEITSFTVYDVLHNDTKGTVYNDISQLNTGEVDSNTCIHFVFFRDNYLYISYYTKGLRVLKFDPTSTPIISERAYWDPEVTFDYSGDDPKYYLGTYGPTFGTYGVYPFLPSGRLVTSSHDGLRVFEYAKSGTVSVNETWEDTVVVGGDIVVASGCTLTISSGCLVEIIAGKDYSSGGANSNKVEFIVNGSLIAESSTDTILFTSSAPSPTTRDWYGIRNYGHVSLKRCRVEYCDYPVRVYSDADSTRIESSALENYYYHGVNVSAGGPLYIKNCRIGNTSSSSSRGISLASSIESAVIDGNTIHKLTGTSTLYGIYVSSTVNNGDVKITNNTITHLDNGATRRGMYLRGDYTLASGNTIKDFNGTAANAFYVYSAVADTLRGNTIYNDRGQFANGIYLSGCNSVALEHDTVADCKNNAIFIYDSDGDLFDNVIEDNPVAYGINANGAYSDMYIEDNHIRATSRDTSCFVGIVASSYAELIVRGSTIEDFSFLGIGSGTNYGEVHCGVSGDAGNNNIYWNLTGDSVIAGSYFIINDDYSDSMDAVYNYYGSSNPSSAYFVGPIDYVPYRTTMYSAKPVMQFEPEPHVNLDQIPLGIYPNPFNSSVVIGYDVPVELSRVHIQVFDANGVLVNTLADDVIGSGRHQATWMRNDLYGTNVNSGVYVIRLQVGQKVSFKRIMLAD